jgi:hypothetical protein
MAACCWQNVSANTVASGGISLEHASAAGALQQACQTHRSWWVV